MCASKDEAGPASNFEHRGVVLPGALGPGQMAQLVGFTSASPRCLDGGDVDLLHGHHRLECTLCLTATSRNRLG